VEPSPVADGWAILLVAWGPQAGREQAAVNTQSAVRRDALASCVHAADDLPRDSDASKYRGAMKHSARPSRWWPTKAAPEPLSHWFQLFLAVIFGVFSAGQFTDADGKLDYALGTVFAIGAFFYAAGFYGRWRRRDAEESVG
jgi:hypothetical protein